MEERKVPETRENTTLNTQLKEVLVTLKDIQVRLKDIEARERIALLDNLFLLFFEVVLFVVSILIAYSYMIENCIFLLMTALAFPVLFIYPLLDGIKGILEDNDKRRILGWFEVFMCIEALLTLLALTALDEIIDRYFCNNVLVSAVVFLVAGSPISIAINYLLRVKLFGKFINLYERILSGFSLQERRRKLLAKMPKRELSLRLVASIIWVILVVAYLIAF